MSVTLRTRWEVRPFRGELPQPLPRVSPHAHRRRPLAAQSTPLAHEAAEFLTDEGSAAFWAFVDAWRGARRRD